MGNYKFRITDVIPRAWFHKLKDMTKQSKPKSKPLTSSTNTCNKKKPSSDSLPNHSSTSHFSISLVANNSPRNSLLTPRMSKRKTLYKPSLKPTDFVKSKINRKTSPESFVYSFYEVENHDDRDFSLRKVKESDSIEKACPANNETKKPQKRRLYVKINKEKEEYEDECKAGKKHDSNGRKSSARRINLKRVNSPRIQLSGSRRSTSSKQAVLESFAVVKRSVDPKRDFTESMVEMIEENNIRASKDLEDLLACYLSLNPKEYHDLIIQVFEQIWRQLTKKK